MENNRSDTKFLSEEGEENEWTTHGRESVLCLISGIFSQDCRCWGIHRLSLGDLRKPAEKSKPTARAYFRLPPPAGKALGGVSNPNRMEMNVFSPAGSAGAHQHHKVGLVQRRSAADKLQVVNNK